jgi:hypothetical protein
VEPALTAATTTNTAVVPEAGAEAVRTEEASAALAADVAATE